MNPAEWLTRIAQTAPERPAIYCGETQVATYGDFARRAAGLAAWLGMQGIAPGDRVALFAKNCPEYLIALYAIWHAGAIAVPINAKLHAREASWIIADSGARLCFTTADHLDGLSDLSESACALQDIEALETQHPPAPPHPTRDTDVIWLFYTSGTTGRPKGVMLTSLNLMLMSTAYLADVDDVSPEDAILYAAPMSHGAGIYNFVHVMRGARHVVAASGGFDAEEVLDLGARIGGLSMFAAPTMVRRLVDVARDRDGQEGIKTIIYGGGPMYVADIIEAVEVMGPRFVQIYGQGECPMAVTSLTRAEVADRSAPDWRERLGSVGRAQSVVRLRIADARGHDVPTGEIGEILVQSPVVMAGYWNNPDSTAQTVKDGWLYTGDMGALDANGYLTLHDRSKDVIISGGTNIYPREVEEALLSHPAVREVSVVGRPDPEWGEEVVAFVVTEPGTTAQALDAHCLAHIARFKRPKHYEFVADLPKNNYGKVLKNELRKRL